LSRYPTTPTLCKNDDCDRPSYCRGLCKPCYNRKWRHANRERINEYQRARRLANLDEYRQRDRDRRTAHRDTNRERSRNWYYANRDRNLENTKQWTAANPERRKAIAREAASRRRVALKSGVVESFRHDEIFIRDNWICQLCQTPVDRTLTHPHPMSVSLDHIVPVSMGGDHTRSNVQTTHLRCNVRKNARFAA
jgi:HNH endonuclease